MSGKFTRKIENFTCSNCGFKVKGTGYTDHCPKCLWSRHVDVNPGDRESKCNGMMKPVRIVNGRTTAIIEYKCMKCGLVKNVKASKDDYEYGSVF